VAATNGHCIVLVHSIRKPTPVQETPCSVIIREWTNGNSTDTLALSIKQPKRQLIRNERKNWEQKLALTDKTQI
jgi:hypothetical protein